MNGLSFSRPKTNMSLEDLSRKIYNGKNSDLDDRIHIYDKYNPIENRTQQMPSPFSGEQAWQKSDNEMHSGQKSKLIIIGSVIAAFVLSVAAYAGYRVWLRGAFNQDRVFVVFEGPKEADSTATIQYSIKYKNNNRVSLKNAKIVLDYAENFQPIDNVNLKFISPTTSEFYLGDIKSGQEGSIPLKGVFYAPKDAPVYLHGTLQYAPSNGTSSYEAKTQLGVNITSAPVIVDVMGPANMVSGDLVEYIVEYKNQDNRPLKESQVRVVYPEGFEFMGADPMPSENQKVWYVGTIEPNSGSRIKIKGKVVGLDGQTKTMVAELGHAGTNGEFALYNRREQRAKLTAPILRVAQRLEGKQNNIVQPGETLRYSVIYENTGDATMRDIIITFSLQGSVLDFAALNLQKGSYDSKGQMITWKPSDIPELGALGPKQTGSVSFTIPVKSIIPIGGPSDKNFVISSVAKIDSPDIKTPIAANKVIGTDNLDLKVASKVIFDNLGFYNDPQIPNTGPLPMEVDKPTSFTLHWAITNVSNDLSGAVIRSSLPSGMRWVGKVYPSDAGITYDERNNSVVWNIGDIAAGSGLLVPRKEVAFQVMVTPQGNQAGQKIQLLNESVFSARDVFTGEDVLLARPPKNTELVEDKGLTGIQFEVKKPGI